MRWPAVPLSNISPESIRKSIESNGKEILDGNTPQDLTWPQPGQNHHSTRSKTYHRHLSTNEGVMLVCYYLEAMRLYCQRQSREENFFNAWREFFFFLSFDFFYMQFVIQGLYRSSNKSLNRLCLNPHEYFLLFFFLNAYKDKIKFNL